jgi:hypothetical protein
MRNLSFRGQNSVVHHRRRPDDSDGMFKINTTAICASCAAAAQRIDLSELPLDPAQGAPFGWEIQ